MVTAKAPRRVIIGSQATTSPKAGFLPRRPGRGTPKASASKAAAESLPDGGTSVATAGKAEKEHAAAAGAQKTQSGRGHRKG